VSESLLPKKPKSRGRAYLVKQLQKRGMSRRDAVAVLNEIFNQTALALAEGEQVAFPFGKLKMVRHKHLRKRGWFLNRITTTYKKPFTVVHVMDAKGAQRLEPKPEVKPQRRSVLPPKPWLQSGK
jgi:hypothetical protein